MSGAVSVANLFIIGAPKAGTTSVAQWLGQHPEVYWCTPKEPFFWASDFPGQRHHHGFDTLSQYEALYSSSAAQGARWRGDGSTTYLYSREALSSIEAHSHSSARYVALVRNPVDLIVSYHRTQIISLNQSESDFTAAWASSEKGLAPTGNPLDPKLLNYQMIGKQGDALARTIELVGRDRLLILVFEDLRRDPTSAWTSLSDFLELDANFTPEFSVHNESNRTMRWPLLRSLVHRPPAIVSQPMARLRQAASQGESAILKSLRQRLWKQTDRPSIDDPTREMLREYFAADVKTLESLLDRALSW